MVDTLLARYHEQRLSGDASAAGGSTDPAVRLDNLLKVRMVSSDPSGRINDLTR